MLIRKLVLISIGALLMLNACKQSPPPEKVGIEEKGDFEFSGFQWKYKNATTPVGPGPNRFLGTTENAFVDEKGYLHLKITKRNNNWFCSEIISTKEFGYGTYVFTCLSDIRNFTEKEVFGFFTWDNYSFQQQGNSEIDVEFSRWNNPNDSLLITYAAQPVIFSNPTPYSERTFKPNMPTKAISTPTTHMMRWTSDSVYWESYAGEEYPGPNKIGQWAFNNKNIPREKIEGSEISNPIVIPAPSDSTNLRLNFWLLNGQAPSNGKDNEVIIKSVKYFPL